MVCESSQISPAWTLANTLDQQLRGGLFENDSRGAEPHGLDEFILIVRRGQHNDPSLVLDRLKPLQSGQAIQAGHLEVEQENVGRELLQDFQYLPAILSLGHHLEVFFQSEQLAEAVPKNGMVVGYHDPDLRTRAVPLRTGDRWLRHSQTYNFPF